jgi:hypothetical protein
MGKRAVADTESYTPEQTAKRRDAVIKAMIAMPPRPHNPPKMDKIKGRGRPKVKRPVE